MNDYKVVAISLCFIALSIILPDPYSLIATLAHIALSLYLIYDIVRMVRSWRSHSRK